MSALFWFIVFFAYILATGAAFAFGYFRGRRSVGLYSAAEFLRTSLDHTDVDETELPSDRDRDLAREVTTRLLSSFGLSDESIEIPYRSRDESPRYDVFLADVEGDVESFSRQLRIVDLSGGFPCVSKGDGNLIPIDVFDVLSNTDSTDVFFNVPRYWERTNEHLREALQPYEVVYLQRRRVVSFFRERMMRFLAVRFSTARSHGSDNPGLRLTVVTKQHGERVHYSPAYFQKVSTVFGSPTTPVKGWIQPGLYSFSVTGTNRPMRFDPGQFMIPPTKIAELHV